MTRRDVEGLLDGLRSSFDEGFARPFEVETVSRDILVAIRIGEERYALRPSELTSLVRAGSTVPLPGAVPGRVGLTSVRGALVPVYDLAVLLGAAPEPVRWLAVHCVGASVGGVFGAAVALGFSELDGSLDAARSELERVPQSDPRFAGVLNDENGRRLVIDVAALVSTIAEACRPTARKD